MEHISLEDLINSDLKQRQKVFRKTKAAPTVKEIVYHIKKIHNEFRFCFQLLRLNVKWLPRYLVFNGHASLVQIDILIRSSLIRCIFQFLRFSVRCVELKAIQVNSHCAGISRALL